MVKLADIPDDWQHKDLEQALVHCKKFDLALDAGAHRGVTVGYLLGRFKSVVAIEPTNLADKISPKARVIKACVGDNFGKCSMADGKHNTGQSYVVEGDDVDIITIDSLDLAPDFIKLDVEGMELNALRGAIVTLLSSKPLVMFEENGLNKRYGIKDGEVGRFLESLGMKKILTLESNPPDKDLVYGW
jgi:FkbM family methyltransferase